MGLNQVLLEVIFYKAIWDRYTDGLLHLVCSLNQFNSCSFCNCLIVALNLTTRYWMVINLQCNIMTLLSTSCNWWEKGRWQWLQLQMSGVSKLLQLSSSHRYAVIHFHSMEKLYSSNNKKKHKKPTCLSQKTVRAGKNNN